MLNEIPFYNIEKTTANTPAPDVQMPTQPSSEYDKLPPSNSSTNVYKDIPSPNSSTNVQKDNL